MADTRLAFVHEADLQLEPGTDPATVGAAVTTALCGHWEHEGPCRWPHNNAVGARGPRTSFRTLFVAPPADEDEVRKRIEGVLREAAGWVVLETRERPLDRSERPLARRLAGGR